MPIRTIATLVIALVLGLIAVVAVRAFLNAPKSVPVAVAAPTGFVPVVVATQAIARGQALEPTNLKVVNFPTNAAPDGTFRDVADVTRQGTRLALSTLVPNEPVLSAKISAPGGKLNMSTEIAAGMRAVSLRANDVSGVGGFVLPGDRVDVLVTRTIGSGDNANTVTQVLAEDVRVMGVDQLDNNEANKPVVAKAVTVEVSPDQAQAISLAQSVGTVSLMLRHVSDDAQLVRQAVTVADLGFGPRKPVGHASGGGVRVIRGGHASMFSFGADRGKQQGATPSASSGNGGSP
jgi:pilus assembly protein CpaB